MEILKKHLPFSGQDKLHELKNIAVRFEEMIYAGATSELDYMRKISVKMLTLENKSPNPMPNSVQSNSVANSVNPSDPGSQGMQQVNNQGQPIPIPVPSNHPQAGQQILSQSIPNNTAGVSSAFPPGSGSSQSTMPNIAGQNSSLQKIQNISGVQQNSVGNNMGQQQGVPSGNFVSQRPIPGRQQHPQNSQHYLYQQQLHQMAKQKLQQNNIATSMQSHIQQQQQNLLQPSHFQPSQQSIMQPSSLPVQQSQQPIVLQSTQPVIQQILRQQRQQQHHSIGQNNNFSVSGPQNGVVGQQQLLGTQLGNSTMLNNQNSAHMLQSKVPIQQQNLLAQGQQSQPQLQQQAMSHLQTQSGQLQHQLNMKPQPNLSQRDMQPRLPTSVAFQQQNVIDQQKQLFQQPRAMQEASSTSSDSTAQTGNSTGGDWQEELHQKIKAMKDKYMPELSDIYQKVTAKLQQHDSLPQLPKGEQYDKLQKYKKALEHSMMFLKVSKNNIQPNFKEKLVLWEKQIFYIINTNKQKPGVTLQQAQAQALPPHHMQLHLAQMPPHENQMNTQMQTVNLQINIGNLQHNSTNLDLGHQQVNINSNILQNQQLKQLQNRQIQQQMLQKQLLLQQQFQRQTKQQQQQNVQFQANQMAQIHQIKDGNELKLRQQMGVKPGSPFSPQIDQQNLLNSLTKSGTPLQSANSPFVVPSPSTPSTSPMPGDFEKVNSSGVLSLCNAATIGNQPTGTMLTAHSPAIGTPGISASPLLAEFTNPDGNNGNGASVVSEKSSSVEQPMEHLLKVVKSMSSKSLSASISEIGSVVSMVDRIAESSPGNGSRVAVGEDLVTMTNCHLQSRTFVTQDGTIGTKKMKRFTDAMPLNVLSSASSVTDSFKQLNSVEASELESTATSTIKRPRIETNHALLEEIKEINKGLVDTVVDISEEDADVAAASVASEGGEGTVVKCSFKAVALDPDLKSRYASGQMSPIQPLRLFVPVNYPNCSPIRLDKFPDDPSKESEDLSLKAKSRFSRCLRTLSQPTSLDEMVRTWDVCVRTSICEHAQQFGGSTFSSKYGTWENFLSAA